MKILLQGGKTKEVVAINIIEVHGRQLFVHAMIHPNGAIDNRFRRVSDAKTGVAISGCFSFEFLAIKYADMVLADPANKAKLDQYPQINELCKE